jgi:hypothetical protein
MPSLIFGNARSRVRTPASFRGDADLRLNPPLPRRPATFQSYSIHARVLPHLEQANPFRLVDLNAAYSSQPAVTQQRIPVYLCPSEVRDQPKVGNPTHYPVSYGANVGTWLAFDPNVVALHPRCAARADFGG